MVISSRSNNEHRCVNCSLPLNTLYIQYSPGNIRLIKCENCKAVADPYIECEFMIIFIDLILHKTKVYRHLLFNRLNIGSSDSKAILWKSSLLYLLLDAYRIFLLNFKDGWDTSKSAVIQFSTCGKLLADVLVGNLVLISIIVVGTSFLLNRSSDTTRFKGIILAILISSYFKLYLITMMVWDFPPSVIIIVDILTLSSNAMSLRVIMELPTAGCLGVCFIAHVAKFIVNCWLVRFLSLTI